MNTLTVELGARSYPIYFRENAQPELVERTLATASSGRVLVLSDEKVGSLYANQFVEELRACGLRAALLTIRAGEAHKSLDSVRMIYERALQFGVDRETPIVSYGGGVIGDVGGFVAATLLRGLPFVQVPTTVLAQVDSSVGGKVGVNLAEGKNLVGAFYQPKWVYIDTDHLGTLEPAERCSGLVEALKHGILADAELIDLIGAEVESLLAGETAVFTPIIRRAVAVKAKVVAEDELEHGRRAILNLGHTLGHALEADAGYGRLRHGEAVALGLRFTLALSARRLRLAQSKVDRVRKVLDDLGGPNDWAARINESVLNRIDLDKKNRGEMVRIIGLRDLGDPVIMNIPLGEFKTLVTEMAQAEQERKMR